MLRLIVVDFLISFVGKFDQVNASQMDDPDLFGQKKDNACFRE